MSYDSAAEAGGGTTVAIRLTFLSSSLRSGKELEGRLIHSLSRTKIDCFQTYTSLLKKDGVGGRVILC